MATENDKQHTQDLVEQIRRLEEKVRGMESAGQSAPANGIATGARSAEPGLAQGVVAALGKLVPGLQKLIEVGSQMPEFHQQLAAIDEEIKRKFKDQPIRASAVTFARNFQAERRTSLGIPPSVRRGRAQPGGPGNADEKPRGGYRRQPDPKAKPKLKVRLSPEAPATLHVDVFDEGRDVVVLADAAGLAADHATATLDGDSLLVIHIDDPRRSGDHRVELPCPVSGPAELSLGNGVLKIRLTKKRPQGQSKGQP